jgi:hypothetical protein
MGFLDRLKARAGIEGNTLYRTTVKQTFNVKVPAKHATAVQIALERWAVSKGWAAIVSSKTEGEYVRLSFEHDESRPGKPPEAGAMTDELQKVIEDAIKPASD